MNTSIANASTEPLDRRVAIVTGGASGIGAALSALLTERGCLVVVFDLRVPDSKLGGASTWPHYERVDVRDRLAVEEGVARVVRDFGRLDYMFNNAGITLIGEVRDYDWAAWSDVIETDLMGVVHGVAAAYPVMAKARSGHIVNTSSLSGLVPSPWATSYAAAKFGVVGLSLSLRGEAAPLGVRVSVVCRASVKTPIVDTARYLNLDKAAVVAAIPGSAMAPELAARQILEGVDENRALITPGLASAMWLVQRLFPSIALSNRDQPQWHAAASGHDADRLGRASLSP